MIRELGLCVEVHPSNITYIDMACSPISPTRLLDYDRKLHGSETPSEGHRFVHERRVVSEGLYEVGKRSVVNRLK